MNRRRLDRLSEALDAKPPAISAVSISDDGAMRSVYFTDGKRKVPSEMTEEELASLADLDTPYKVYIGISPDDL
jgi:hypothetical protein